MIHAVLHSRYDWIWRYSEFLNAEQLISLLLARIVCWIIAGNFFACGVEIEFDEWCLFQWREVA